MKTMMLKTLSVCTLGMAIAMPSVAFGETFQAKVSTKIQALREQGKREGWTFQVDGQGEIAQGHEYATGLVRPGNWKELAKFSGKNNVWDKEKLPAKWDWRDRGGVTPIKNQGSCGSCWAFGTVAAFESAIMIATGKLTSLSEQQLVSCSPSYGSCNGGYYAFGLYEKHGANYTEDFPYKAQDVSCKEGLAENEGLMDWFYVGQNDKEPTIEEIKSAIFNYGVVAVTISASGAFDSYKSGIYNACNSGQTNHIVAITGWDDETETWMVKNSWGKNWGEDGYIRMKWNGSNGVKCNRVGESAAYGIYNPRAKLN